ncbi:MAG TPA: polysaccharide deacetylase [Mycobacteriales bacterium]|nr:polysaccharide deacetylase [Mycobacteriales bacterium]
MKRNALLVGAIVVALAFTLFARTEADNRQPASVANPPGQPTQPASPGSTGPGSTSPSAVDPDSFFTPTRLRPGQRPPQFIVVSFDGAGSHAKWEYWRDVAAKANMRFTGFLSGVYLVGEKYRRAYTGPGHSPGRSSIGFFSAAEVRQVVEDLNDAWRRGDEIGTHYNGHFCAGAGYAANDWTTADWTSELQQFLTFFRDYKQVNHDDTMPTLEVPVESIKGGRTPCLEGRPGQLMPALRRLGLSYDSSGNRSGIAWPKKNRYGIWELPMGYVPLAGTSRGVISMDYNFWVQQTGDPPTTGDSVANSRQVLATYQRMYRAAYNGNRAPLILGNHFNSWNNNAYTQALASFVRQACRQPDTYCVPYRDVIRWMRAQDPAELARLQALPAVDTA